VEPHDAVPGRAIEVLDSCPWGGDQDVCVFRGASAHLGDPRRGRDARTLQARNVTWGTILRTWQGCCLSLMLLLTAISASAQESKVLPQATVAHTGYPNSWAVVIGINAYQKAPRLHYAVADAKAVAALLPSLGFPEQNTFALLDGDATRLKIESVLYRNLSGMGPHDRLFFYFAGHGETLPIRKGEEGYLLPVDADPDALALTAIAMDELKRASQRLPAKHYLFVMDACFSGFAVTRDAAPNRISDEYLISALREPVVQVITAGRKGEQSIEEEGHGLFTRRLLDGLRGLADTEGRGLISAAQLAAWIEPRVVRDSKGKMTPQYGKLDGEGQFLFFRPGSVPPRVGSSDDLSGTFTGMISGTAAGRSYSMPVTLTIVQRGSDLSGTWTTVIGSSGTITGIVDRSSVRTFQVNQANPCPAAFNGNAVAESNGNRLRGSYAGSDCKGYVVASFTVAKVTREETLSGRSQQPRDLTDIGLSYWAQQRPVDALDYFERGLRLAEKLGDEPEQMRGLALIGTLHSIQGRDVEALSLLEQSLQLARKLGHELSMASTLNVIGMVHLGKARDAEALSHFDESLRLAEKLGDEAQQARVLLSLASLDLHRSRYSQALSRLQRAIEIADRLGLAEKEQIRKMRDEALSKAR